MDLYVYSLVGTLAFDVSRVHYQEYATPYQAALPSDSMKYVT